MTLAPGGEFSRPAEIALALFGMAFAGAVLFFSLDVLTDGALSARLLSGVPLAPPGPRLAPVQDDDDDQRRGAG